MNNIDIVIYEENVKNESNDTFNYQLLDRCVSDCKYFLGNGGRCEEFLWGGNVKNHIKKMKELYNQLEIKPELLTILDIENYEKQMLE
jgi:hypothetical protein